MRYVSAHLIGIAFAVAAFVPSPSGAETLLSPWVGFHTGSQSGSSVDVGASVGATAAGIIGAEFDLGYSPDFFGNSLNSYVLTTMGNVVVGIPLDGTQSAGIRPYVTGGVGLIRARIENPINGFSVANNDVGVNFGGGVMGFFGAHVGVRGDLRYVRSLEDDNATNPFNVIDLARLHYWRTSFALVLR